MNLGMVLQIFLSIFPIGIYQFWLSVANDYWYLGTETGTVGRPS